MPDAFRRFRRHPIYTTIGALWVTLMLGLTSLVWLGALFRMAKGEPLPHNLPLALAVVSILSGWYLNFQIVYHRLRRIDAQTYAWATKDMGFIALVFARRGSPAYLHNALARLDLTAYPPSFRAHVRFTLLLNVILLWGFCVVVVGAFVWSLLTGRH